MAKSIGKSKDKEEISIKAQKDYAESINNKDSKVEGSDNGVFKGSPLLWHKEGGEQ